MNGIFFLREQHPYKGFRLLGLANSHIALDNIIPALEPFKDP